MTGWQAVGYGLGGGFERDRKDAEKQRREEIQLQEQKIRAQAAKPGYSYDISSGQYTPTDDNYQAQAMQMLTQQLKMVQSTMMSDNTWNTLTSDVQSGNFSGMNKLLADPNYKNLFAGANVAGIKHMSRDNSEDMQLFKNSFSRLGYSQEEVDKYMSITQDEEGWKAIREAFPIVTGLDGKPRIVSMEDINIALGGAKRTDAMKTSKILGDVYSAGLNALKGKNSEIVEAEKQQKQAEASLASTQTNNAIKWLEANPDKTYQDWLNSSDIERERIRGEADVKVAGTKGYWDTKQEEMKGKYDVLEQSVKPIDTKKLKEAEDISIASYINDDIDRFANTVKTAEKNDRVQVGDKDYSVYEMAKFYEDNQKQQLDNNFKNELRGKRNVIKGAERILAKLDNIENWNIGTKALSETERIVGSFISNLTNDITSNSQKGQAATNEMKRAIQSLPEQDRIYMESYVFPVVADYIKAMSGAAVSEQERTAYVSNMTSGWLASKSAFTNAITGFRDSVSDSFTGMMDSISSSYPKTYLDLRLRETKVYKGVTYEKIGNQWVAKGAK